ncbi:MAG: PqqD family protein [Lachnospiraceae bacterium]|nr:PqqD family protein [Lachnospiraceae bacterium]MEE3356332.1 PqqD family protein [Candidatus Weimeria sp.]
MKKKKRLSRSEALALYKTYVPVISEKIHHWEKDENGDVTLFVENRGIMNTVMQKLMKKPRFSQIHLDAVGSFIWPRLDGETDLKTIAGAVEEQFGEKVHPLYERLLKFFEIVESYDFITWKKPV